jgi:hypothetical protein
MTTTTTQPVKQAGGAPKEAPGCSSRLAIAAAVAAAVITWWRW